MWWLCDNFPTFSYDPIPILWGLAWTDQISMHCIAHKVEIYEIFNHIFVGKKWQHVPIHFEISAFMEEHVAITIPHHIYKCFILIRTLAIWLLLVQFLFMSFYSLSSVVDLFFYHNILARNQLIQHDLYMSFRSWGKLFLQMMGNWEYEIVVSLCLETVPKELCFFFYFFRILRKATGIQEVKEEMVNIACNCSLFCTHKSHWVSYIWFASALK